MINRLYTRDFAILKELELEFMPGFTIITGETGAGKSILLQALSLALGAKGNKNMVKSGKIRAMVEAYVDGKSYRRILSDKGRMKSYIEDEPVKEIDFKSQTAPLADFNGQHEQQFIMNRDKHVDYLDRYCDLEEKVKKITDIFHSLISTKNRFKTALETQESNEERKELLEFQFREIDGVNPKKEEDIHLTNDFKILNHIDELVESIEKITQDFTESDHSIYNRLSAIVKELNKLGSYDKNLKNYLEGLNNVITTIQDTSISLSGYSNSLNPDKENLNNIEIRLQDIESLKRKYGGSLEAVKVYQNDMKHELENLINLETNLSLNNLNRIIKSKPFKFLDGIVIGRSDLAGSLNLTRQEVNSKLIFNKVRNAFKKIKSTSRKKLIFKMGGSITPMSSNFINKLYLENLLHKIETRNIEIKLSKHIINNLEHIIPKIFDFELEWLKFKLNMAENKKNRLVSMDYSSRIKEIEKRLGKNK